MGLCTIPGCSKTRYRSRYYCSHHLYKFHRYGDASHPGQRNLAPDELTTREAEVVKLLVVGFTNKETANRLFISVKTVEKHRGSAYKKWDIRGGFATIMLAKQSIKRKLITMEEFLA